MNSVHVRSKIVNLLQKGDLDGVLQIANRLNRVEQRDPLLLDLLDTVKKRLDQMEEDETLNSHSPAPSTSESEEECGSSDSSGHDNNETDSSEGNTEDNNDDEQDLSDSDINSPYENDSITETSDSGICVSE